MMPSLFISHGSPMLPLMDTPASRFLAGLGEAVTSRYGRPRAILVASAHWETEAPVVNAVNVNATIHDFYGFPPQLYALTYPAPGDAALADRVGDLLCAAGLPSRVDTERGLDHGAWCPLLLAWPKADVPVLQVSIQSHLGPAHHDQLGAALRPLREQGILVVGSGSWTHDLRRVRHNDLDAPETADVTAFSAWMHDAIMQGRRCDLLTYRHRAPYAADQHPTEEHLLPLYVALGAGGPTINPEPLHHSVSRGVLRMDAYAFH